MLFAVGDHFPSIHQSLSNDLSFSGIESLEPEIHQGLAYTLCLSLYGIFSTSVQGLRTHNAESSDVLLFFSAAVEGI